MARAWGDNTTEFLVSSAHSLMDTGTAKHRTEGQRLSNVPAPMADSDTTESLPDISVTCGRE